MFDEIFPKIIVVLITSTSLVTSGAAGLKIAKNLQPDSLKPQSITLKADNTLSPTNTPPSPSQPPTTSSRTTPPPTPRPTSTTTLPLLALSTTTLPSSTPRPTLTSVISRANSTSPTPTSGPNATDCIITLFGKLYNVTTLRTTHSGGNIFSCGTDMTTTYQSKHGTNLSRMQPYLVSATPSTAPSSPSTTPMPTSPAITDDDQDEDHEDEDRYLKVEEKEDSHEDEDKPENETEQEDN